MKAEKNSEGKGPCVTAKKSMERRKPAKIHENWRLFVWGGGTIFRGQIHRKIQEFFGKNLENVDIEY